MIRKLDNYKLILISIKTIMSNYVHKWINIPTKFATTSALNPHSVNTRVILLVDMLFLNIILILILG